MSDKIDVTQKMELIMGTHQFPKPEIFDQDKCPIWGGITTEQFARECVACSFNSETACLNRRYNQNNKTQKTCIACKDQPAMEGYARCDVCLEELANKRIQKVLSKKREEW